MCSALSVSSIQKLYNWVLTAATAALKRKKATELELERLQGTRFQLEMQVNTLESASFNAETMDVMKKASSALKDIHGKLCVHYCTSAKTVADHHYRIY